MPFFMRSEAFATQTNNINSDTTIVRFCFDSIFKSLFIHHKSNNK